MTRVTRVERVEKACSQAARRGRGLLAVVAAAGFVGSIHAATAQVTLPLERYETLRSQARQPDAARRQPPAPYGVESVELELQAGEGSARLTSTWHLALFSSEWQSVPFLPSGSIVSADFGGLEGRVDATGGWSLRVRGAGRHTVRLESVVPVQRDLGATRPTWRLVVHVPPAAAAHGTVTVQPAIEDVSLEGPAMILASHPTATVAARSGVWELLARPGASITITLAGKATMPERARLPLRFEASSATVATLSRTQLKLHAWIEARVAQGRLEELRVPLPAGFEVAGVTGAFAGWKTVDGVLIVTPLAPIEGSWPLSIALSGAPRDAFASPLLLPEKAVRVQAFAATEVKGDGLPAVVEPGSARAADDGELQRLPEDLRHGGQRFYVVPDPKRPPRFEISWAEGTQVLAAQIDRLLVEVAAGEGGRASYRVWAEVRNRGAQQLVMELPPGFELAAAARDQAQVRAGQTAGSFSLPLAAGERVQVLRLAGLLTLDVPIAGEFAVPLPRLSAPVARVEVRALLPGGRTYTLVEPTRGGAVAPPPQAAAAPAPAANVAQQAVLAAVRALPADAPFALPLGYIEIDAAWNALSPAPPPLALRVKQAKEDYSWY